MKPKRPAWKTYRVQITDLDIEKGVRGSPTKCAIARACRRAGLKDVRVDEAGIYIRAGQLENLDEISAWISDWDDRKPVRPFGFRIELGPFQGIVLEEGL